MTITSPSSTQYNAVTELGTPEVAADNLLVIYLNELMSTRIGVRRASKVVSAAQRTNLSGGHISVLPATSSTCTCTLVS